MKNTIIRYARHILTRLAIHLGFKYDLRVYDHSFFRENEEKGVKLAAWFIPLLQQTFSFKSMLDVGCGSGYYMRSALDHGITDVNGIEGAPDAFEHLMVPPELVRKHDLREPLMLNRKWDLAISIEVAEHIERRWADNYVSILTEASDTVVLTAAPPGQRGTAHVNEQPQAWWIDRFASYGFRPDEEATGSLKEGTATATSNGHYVTSWFGPNIMVFRRAMP